jgi:hypothetical protein
MKHLSRNLALLALGLAGAASALPISFVYQGWEFGVMDLSVVSGSTVQVKFTAASGPIYGVTDFQATGFAFAFADSYLGGNLSVGNPDDAAYTDDQNSLDWSVLSNMNAIPTASNSGIKKSAFDFGVTDGNMNNYNPPGIHMGQMDIFTISGFTGLATDDDIAAAITLEGVRIQAIAPSGGSLFLTGTPAVPEPGMLAMMGIGLMGLAFASRRKR